MIVTWQKQAGAPHATVGRNHDCDKVAAVVRYATDCWLGVVYDESEKPSESFFHTSERQAKAEAEKRSSQMWDPILAKRLDDLGPEECHFCHGTGTQDW